LEKNQFHNILHNYTSLTEEEAQELIFLEKKFPFSQVVRVLAARAARDNSLSESEDQLHLSAIYATDRGVFKSVMTSPKKVRKEIVIEINERESLSSENIVQTISESDPELFKPDLSLSGDLLYDEVMHDIARLKELKHQYEETVKQIEEGKTFELSDIKKKDNEESSHDEELIQEIKSSKKKIKPSDTKQKEQLEIIENFIKTEPTLLGKAPAFQAQDKREDLSDKSLIYSENIISETLAQILISQGKKDKAIEVLKKLIWKFPQKKAYFAAQIEELKK
jgi:hypothetical protein